MSMSMYSASVPIFIRMLTNLSACLDKGVAHAELKKFEPAVLLQSRLAPDMFPLVQQVQIACDAAKFGVARLAGIDAPKFADTESSFPELKERIQKTLAFVESVKPEQLNGTEERDVTVPRRQGSLQLKGEVFLKQVSLPNFFFHVTTAYAILRHNGVGLGKSDYLGPL